MTQTQQHAMHELSPEGDIRQMRDIRRGDVQPGRITEQHRQQRVPGLIGRPPSKVEVLASYSNSA